MKEAKLFKQDIAIQAILYILKKMGGTCDIHKCHKILYFADNEHLSKYGRSITGDAYVRMDFGPVPTCIYDLFKAVRGDSFFASQVDDVRKGCFHFVNNKDIAAVAELDMSYLSESDVEMLNKYIEKLKDKDFIEVTDAIETAPISKPVCPVYQNVDALPHTDPVEIKDNLLKQLTAPIGWTQSVINMINDGMTEYVECGQGRVLTGLIGRIMK